SGGGDTTPANNAATDPTTIVPVPSNLVITSTHAGAFTQGQIAATYTLTVSNIVGGGPTAGTVTVTEILPAELTATALSGAGWGCDVETLSCTRSDTLLAGFSYPPIGVTVDVAIDAPPSVTNTAAVDGGGDVTAADNLASDPTTVVAAVPDLIVSKTHAGSFT